MMLLLEVFVFGLAFWLGTYLVNRNLRDVRLGLAGWGLTAYAFALALDILAHHAPDPAAAAQLLRWERPFLLLPALFWLALLFVLLRGDEVWHSRLQNHRRPFIVVLAVTIFFGLGLSLLIFPTELIPRNWLLLGIGFDLVLLGLAVGVLDASDEGQTLWAHSARSFIYAFFTALIFGGQVALVMGMATGASLPMIALLLTIVTVSIASQTFAEPLQRMLDRLAPGINREARHMQAALRETADALPRQNPDLKIPNLDEAEFTRLTRRALSHMNNLPRLASSPLTRLPVINMRLQERNESTNTLQRAAELRMLLSESIERLKPQTGEDFGVSDDWRYYNALYIPYVLGVKPYSRRAHMDELDTAVTPVVEWMRIQVPQRTLYNWQNAAAQLVAQDLREYAQNQRYDLTPASARS